MTFRHLKEGDLQDTQNWGRAFKTEVPEGPPLLFIMIL